MSAIIDSLLPVFLMIMLGAGLTSARIVPREAWHGVERLSYYVLFPALITTMLARANMNGDLVLKVALIQVAAVIVMTGLCLALLPLLRARQIDGAAFTSIFQGAVRWNSFAALAIASSLYGSTGAVIVAMALAIMTPFINFVVVGILSHYAASTPVTARAYVGTMLKNPLIWSCIVGGFLNISGLALPGFLFVSLDMLGKAALAVGLVMIGGGLDLKSLHRLDLPVLVSSTLKLLVMPLLVAIGAMLSDITGQAYGALLVCAGVPTAAASYVLAKQMGGDAPLMARITTIQTLLAFATLPLVIIAGS